MGKPGIILTMEFSPPQAEASFGEYADYMARSKALLLDKKSEELREKEAKEIIDYHRYLRGNILKADKDYGKYVYYMTRSYAIKESKKENKKGEKILPGVFSDSLEEMSAKDKVKFSKILNHAQEKGSVMWEDVVSFDNNFLEKHGLYNSKTKELDEERLQKATRKMMTTLIDKEQLKGARWMASIHRNTDNIHIHLCTVEEEPSRKKVYVANKSSNKKEWQPRGKRKQSTLNHMKNDFGNELLQMSDLFISVSQQRDASLNHLKQYLAKSKKEKSLFLYKEAIQYLDENVEADWYKKVAFNHFSYKKLPTEGKEKIDRIPKVLSKRDKALNNELEKFDALIAAYNETFEKMYGKKYNPNESFKETRKKDLKERLGNATLKELGKFKKEELNQKENNVSRKDLWLKIKNKEIQKKKYTKYSTLEKSIWTAGKRSERNLIRTLRRESTIESRRALQDYQQMLRDVENAQER